MLARIALIFTFLFLVFPFLTSASAIAVRGGGGASGSAGGGGGGGGGGGNTTIKSCNTGKLNCCNSVQSADSKDAQHAAGLVSALLGPITGQVGLTCNPISVIGVNGNSCSAQPACCTGNTFSGGGILGLLTLGCDPINVNV